jgi:multidrug resistance efflux pump
MRERLLALLLLAVAQSAAAVVLTGEVRSSGAQEILTPPSNSSPVVLRTFVPDGTRVKKGDLLLGIDAGEAASQLRKLRDQAQQTRDKTAKEVADLELKEVDAELALVDAQAKRDTAAVDAAIPKSLLSKLDYDRYQGTFKSTSRDAALKATELAAAKAAVQRRREDGALQVKKIELQLATAQAQVDNATVHASRAGVVVHAFEGQYSLDNGARFEEGSSSYPGTKVGEVVWAGGNDVRAWALQPDRGGLRIGQPVRLYFDALPGVHADGRIRSISGASDSKPEWGDGRYYAIDIDLAGDVSKLHLLPGMSVRVQTDTNAPLVAVKATPPAAINADGEIFAQSSLAIMPPQVEGLWQMNITQMAGDGAHVKKGDPLVTFAAGDLAQTLPAKMSELAEKRRTQEQLRLELADRARETALALAQARADAEKAKRKAEVPEQYVAGIDYKKLVIDRRKAERRLELTERRTKVDAQARAAAQRVADNEAAQLQQEVTQMQASLASLTIRAPRDGIFLHHSMWNGDQMDVGSTVWRGMSVGELPDMNTLAVRASLPERDFDWVRVGQRVRVELTGGASGVIGGVIRKIGNTVHSKSRVAPVPVLDLLIQLDPTRLHLKPGQPVRVRLTPDQGVAA